MNEVQPELGSPSDTYLGSPRPVEVPLLRSFASISPGRYRHSGDARAMEVLRNSAGLEDLVRTFSEQVQERHSRLDNVVNNIRVGTRQLSDLHALFTDCCARLGAAPDIELYVTHGANAWTSGAERPYVAIGADLLRIMNVKELLYILGHEVGHVLMQHAPYYQMALYAVGTTTSIPLLSSIPIVGGMLKTGLRLSLLHWSRLSELSADRAGLLACQDFQTAGRALMKLSGFPLALIERVNLETCVDQAKDLDIMSEDRINALLRFAAQADRTHPWAVIRVAEMHQWFTTGEYGSLFRESPSLSAGVRQEPLHYARAGFRCPVCENLVDAADHFCRRCGAPVRTRDRVDTDSTAPPLAYPRSGDSP